jgi:carbamate kinase
MMIVAALGGNALLRRGQPLDPEERVAGVKTAARDLAQVAHEHSLVVTHGNGPQIGLLALQSEAHRDVRTYPLDVLGAESEGVIGYLLERELGNALADREVASIITQVVVSAHDPGFRAPTTPVGPRYSRDDAARLAADRGWSVAPDGDDGHWRRVVASPVPLSVVELGVIRLLVDHGVVVICGGGGGIPVVLDADGARHGVDAVVDKDAATALLARQLGADLLLLLTDVPAVELDWGSPSGHPVARTTPEELRTREFADGTMKSKVEAASWFVSTTGRRAAIGALADVEQLVAGRAGTTIVPESEMATSSRTPRS